MKQRQYSTKYMAKREPYVCACGAIIKIRGLHEQSMKHKHYELLCKIYTY